MSTTTFAITKNKQVKKRTWKRIGCDWRNKVGLQKICGSLIYIHFGIENSENINEIWSGF